MTKLTDGFAPALLDWYDRHARALPWRMPPGEARRADPYHVLVSEVMLQQTTVQVVETRFRRFLEQFPNLEALASAEEEEVLAAWAGLGYYRRARSLHACAKALVAEHDGAFPEDEIALKTLPGVGDYTSAAIAAIAFGRAAVVVDGNIERVVSRVFAIGEPLPGGRKAIRAAAEELTPEERGGDYAQAMMDLGASVCRPRAPDCLLCPVRTFCRAAEEGAAERYPVKAPKKEKKEVFGRIFVTLDGEGRVFCVPRGSPGLFAGMLGLPGGGWDGSALPDPGEGELCGSVEHVLTHRRLTIDVYETKAPLGEGRWIEAGEARAAMPTLFRKALDRVLGS